MPSHYDRSRNEDHMDKQVYDADKLLMALKMAYSQEVVELRLRAQGITPEFGARAFVYGHIFDVLVDQIGTFNDQDMLLEVNDFIQSLDR